METHDASTSKRYQAAAQEAQATIAKQATRIAALEAHIRKFANRHSEAARRQQELVSALGALMDSDQKDIADDLIKTNLLCAEKHLAALNHTEGKKKIDDAVDKAWSRFCAAMPDDQSPYPGMAKAFEVHYGVSWTDRDWRNEQSTWAAAWRMAWDRRATVLDAEQDAARLDFLDSIGAAYGFEDTHEGNRWMIDGPFNSLRAAIDAAIDAAIEKGGANGKVKVPA